MSTTGQQDGGTREGLGALVEGVRAHLLKRATLTVGLWLLVVLAVTLGLAWLLSGPGGWGRGSPAPLILDLGLLVAAGAGAGLLWGLVRRRLTEVRIARGLDRIGGFGRGAVLGSLELSRTSPPGVSPALVRSSEASVLRGLPGDPEHLARPLGSSFRRWTKRAAAVLAFALPGLVLLAVTSPDRSLSAWSGLLRPAAVMATPSLPPLSVEPADGRLPRGSDLEVVVEAQGREQVRLRWQFDGDVARGREAPVTEGRAHFDLGALEAPVEYRATAPDGARSQRVRLVPEDPLLVTDLRVELTFPPHTGRSPQQYLREVPPLEIPAGTEIRFDGRASRPLGSVRLLRSRQEEAGAAGAEIEVEGDRFSGRWRPRESGRYEWTLRAEDGTEPASPPPPLELTVVPDSAPSVEFLSPGRDTVLPLDRKQSLVIRASDDYGLGSLELVAYRVSSLGEQDEPVVRSLRTGGVRAAVARPVLDVSTWDLMPGDTVRYRARVSDNAPRAQTAETREYVLRVARRSQAARELQEQLESATRTVDSLATEAGRAARETRELERRGTRSPDERGSSSRSRSQETASSRSDASGGGEQETSFESREEVRRAVEQQQDLMSAADSIRSELAEARRAVEESAMADPELRRDLEELESLMSEAAPKEMKDELRQTSERLGEMDSQELEQALEELARSQESFRERVEESLERFRRAAAEQDFRATAREARDLAEEESALADAMESAAEQDQTRTGREEESREGEPGAGREQEPQQADPGAEPQQGEPGAEQEPRQGEPGADRQEGQQGEAPAGQEEELNETRARQQEELSERAGDLQKQMEGLEQRLSELGEQDARQGVQEAREEVEDAAREMEESSGSSREQRMSEAAEQAQSAAGRLQRSADGLDAARQQMAQQRTEQLEQAFQQSSAEALSLARRQSELQERMGGASGEEMSDLQGDEAALLEGLQNLSSSLSGPTSQAPEAGGEVQEAVDEAMQSVQQTLDAMEGGSGTPTPSAASSEAVESLNRLAQSAARAAQQAGGQTGGQGGSPQLQQQLQDVAQKQGGLAERAGALQPMQLGQSSLRRQLGEMAGEQESVAGELGELARQPGSGEALGDLERMAEEARDLADRLEGGRLDPETVRRQQRLFHRLLDAGRSLEKNERSQEREARTAETVGPADVEPLTTEDRGGTRFSLPRAEVLQALPPAQRALIVRYFERLNRSAEGSEGDGGGDR